MAAVGDLWRSPPFWALLAFAAFGAVVMLALAQAIGKPVAVVSLIVPAALFYRALRLTGDPSRDAACGNRGKARQRYTRRIMAFTAVYLLAFALQTMVSAEDSASVGLRAALAVLPALAVLGVFWSIGRLIVEETDEFQRMLVVRQVLIATALALGTATLWGFLEAAEVVPHVDAYWVAVVWFFGQMLGAVANRIAYGSWGAL
ncbi:hypothetical protein [Tsuneonella sp. SYSU-LHT278]|uniref:hypothetical protein n=1 Tax=Tsuneonella sediminis TaxID=3416089 RepID=UPI003F7ACD17